MDLNAFDEFQSANAEILLKLKAVPPLARWSLSCWLLALLTRSREIKFPPPSPVLFLPQT